MPGPVPHVPGKAQLQRGVLLVAHRDLRDPNFSRSVVLITEFDQSGTVGLVLNRPLPVPAAEALPPLAGIEPGAGRLFLGGPVAPDTLQLLLRTDANLGPATKLLGGVHLVTGLDLLQDLIDGRIRASALRLYAGYAGWSPGQLESELLRGDWFLWEADAGAIFAEEPERLWPDLIERAGAQWVLAPGADAADVAVASQYNYLIATGVVRGPRECAGSFRRGVLLR